VDVPYVFAVRIVEVPRWANVKLYLSRVGRSWTWTRIGTSIGILTRGDRHKLLTLDGPIRSISRQLILVERRRGNKLGQCRSQVKFNTGRRRLGAQRTCEDSGMR
jgi:hypothetical protein